MSEPLPEEPTQPRHRGRDFLVGLTGTAGQDVRSWSEAVGPVILFGMVCVNALVAFGSWWLASRVFFDDLTPRQRIGVGAIGGLLIGFIDWMVVSSHPNLPSWFTSGNKPPLQRVWWRPWHREPAATTITDDGGVIPQMPRGWRYVAPYLARMALAAVIAVFIGTGVSIAANEAVVIDQRRQDAIAATRYEQDAAHRKSVDENERAMGQLKEWESTYTELSARVERLSGERKALQDQLPDLEQKIKCESVSEHASQPAGACTGIKPSRIGWERAVEREKDTRTQITSLNQTIAELQQGMDAGRPTVPDVIPPSTSDVPNPKFEQGLGPTLNAYFKVAATWPWYLEWGVFLLLLAFDLTPVVFKMLFGYPPSDHRAWARHSEAVLRRLDGPRQLRLKAAPEELALAQHVGALNGVRVAAAETATTARATAQATRSEHVQTAREAAQAERPAAVAAAAQAAQLGGEAREKIAAATAEHQIQQALLDLQHDAEQRATTRGTPQTPEDDPTPEDTSPKGQTGPRDPVDDDQTPPEPADEAPDGSSQQEQAPWNPAARFPRDSVWQHPNGNSYLIGPSIVPPSDARYRYSRNDVKLMIEIQDRGTSIPAQELPSICKVLKQVEPAGPEARMNDVLPYSGQAFGSWWVAPYYPRSDLERYLSQVGNQGDKLRYTQVVEWGRDLLGDLRSLHQQNWAHNDIKARNVVVEGNVVAGSTRVAPGPGRLHLIDFGSATRLGEPAKAGSPGWLPPELPQDPTASRAGDIFAVSAVLFYAVTGQRVNEVIGGLKGNDLLKFMTRPGWHERYATAWHSQLPALLSNGVPTSLASKIMEGLHPEHQKRPKLDDFHEELGEMLNDRTLRRPFTPPAKGVYPSGFSAPIMDVVVRQLGYVIK